MPFRIEDFTNFIILVIFAVIVVIVAIVIVTVRRRVMRENFFRELDNARERAKSFVEALLVTEKAELDAGIEELRQLQTKAEKKALEEVLLKWAANPKHLPTIREIARKLGWIDEWIQTLRSQAGPPTGAAAKLLTDLKDSFKPSRGKLPAKMTFVTRCQAAGKLATIPTPEGTIALIAAIFDPHPDVQEVCLRYLGQLGDPAVLPILVDELIKVIEGNSLQSIRNVKTALVQFALEDVKGLMPALAHPQRRVRFLATDTIREIADRHAAKDPLRKNDFSPEIYHIFIDKLWQDEWGDVRARATGVIGHFHDQAGGEILAKLVKDKEWFVRLHACRALDDRAYLSIAPALMGCLTDPHWLVREAATKTLLKMGDLGAERIILSFIQGRDLYSAEQICEEMERSGMIFGLLESLEAPDSRMDELSITRTGSSSDAERFQATGVVRRMVTLGKVTMLLTFLRSPVRPEQKLGLIHELKARPTMETVDALHDCAENDPDPRVCQAAFQAFEESLKKLEAQENQQAVN